MSTFIATVRHNITDTVRTITIDADTADTARYRAKDGGWIVESLTQIRDTADTTAEESENGGGDSVANTDSESVPHDAGALTETDDSKQPEESDRDTQNPG